jgi:hypothetical protein
MIKPKKSKGRLAARIKEYEETIKRLKGSEAAGYRKPGSMRLRKGH